MTLSSCAEIVTFLPVFCGFMIVVSAVVWIVTAMLSRVRVRETTENATELSSSDARLRHMLQQNSRFSLGLGKAGNVLSARHHLIFWSVLGLLAVYIPRALGVC